MLDNLRNLGRSWVAKILIGLLILAVAGFGLPSIFLDLNANTVARVGSQNVSARDFERIYRGQINQFAQQTGMAPTAQQSVAFGLPNSVLARLANEAAINELAENLGLGASDARLAQLVRQDPSFASSFGIFDSREFSAMLRQSGMTENEYLNIQRNVAGREQLAMVFQNAHIPQIATDLARAYDNDQRTIEYVELNPVLFEVMDEPSEAELAQFYAENVLRFRTVETRLVSILPLTAEALAQGIDLTEAQVEAEYTRISGQLIAPERRVLHELALPDDETAQLFAQAREAGTSFAAIVSQTGLELEVDELGAFAQAEIGDQALAATAFGLEENGYALVDGPQGQHVIWVSSITESGPQPLDAVRAQVEQSARQRIAQDMLFTVYDDIEEARAAFLPIEDVATRYGLEVYDVALTRGGIELGEIPVLPSGSEQPIVDAVFNATIDAPITPAVNLGSNRTVFFTLDEIQPERDRTLDEVREEAVLAWQDLQTDLALTEAAETMVAAIDAGSDIFTVAAEQGQFPQASAPFSRTFGGAELDPDVAQAAFLGGEGHAGYVPTQTGEVVVFQVTSVTPAETTASSQIAEAFEDSFADVMFSNFVEGLRADLPIRINEEAVNRIIGLE